MAPAESTAKLLDRARLERGAAALEAELEAEDERGAIQTVEEEAAAQIAEERRFEALPISAYENDPKLQGTIEDPLPCARALAASHYAVQGEKGLMFWQEEFLQFRSGAWISIPNSEVSATIYGFLDALGQKPNRRRVSDVLDALKATVFLSSRIQPPCWLDDQHRRASDFVICRNGAFDLATGTCHPLTPRLFTRVTLPVNYEPNAPRPVEWLKFLHTVWPDDPESLETLQEMVGLLLTPETRFQKIFLLIGPKRSGKGTILRTISSLLGSENVAAPTLGSLSQTFGLQPLIGKLAALVGDARLSGKADQAAITERLLSISGEDSVSIARKFLPDYAARLGIRFVLCTNELPRLADSSGALASRFVLLVLQQSFYGSEDLRLADRLKNELASILQWAIEGRQRLLARGYFRMPASAAGAVEQLEDLSSPISAFLREQCSLGPGLTTPIDGLYAAWCDWCETVGRKSGTKQTFGRDLAAASPGLKVTQPRGPDGKQYRVYEGISLTRTDTHINSLHSHMRARVTCNGGVRVSSRVCSSCAGEGCERCS